MSLKVRKMGERAPGSLFTGDMLEVGTSHQLKINGDESWISYKIATKVQEGESVTDAHERAMSILTTKMEDAVKKTVASVEKMSE